MALALILVGPAGAAIPSAESFTQTAEGQESWKAVPWKGFKEGSWVKLKTSTKVDGLEVSAFTTRQTLKTVERDGVLLQTEIREGDAAPEKFEGRLPIKSSNVKSKRMGEEKLKCDGKVFPCEVWQIEDEGEIGKVWVSKDSGISDGIVKMESTRTTPSGKTIRRKRVIKLSERITIASKEVECWVFEHELHGEGLTVAGKEWHSASVPGSLVRFEQRGFDGKQKVELVEEVEGFEASK